MSSLIAAGDMTFKQRDALLASMTEEVGLQVLVANYQQTAAVSLEATHAARLLPTHAQLMRKLESQGALDRAIEFLPDDKAIGERARMGRGLTAPEISVLLAYSKIALKEAILASSIPDAEEFQSLLVDYFPAAVLRECAAQIPTHPLKREIITTQIVSRLVNRMGTSFALQIADETGAKLEAIITAWYAASELLGAEALWGEIEALDLKIPASEQMALMIALREMVGAATRQILASQMASASVASIVVTYGEAVIEAVVAARAGKEGGAAALTAELDARANIVGVFELVDLARASKKSLEQVTAACARVNANVDLAWLAAAIDGLPAGNRWQARARAQLAGELRKLRESLLQRGRGEDATANAAARAVIDDLKRNAPQDLAMLSAGLAEIGQLLLA